MASSDTEFDELMGPTKDELNNMLQEAAVRTSSSGAPPPSGMFANYEDPPLEETHAATQKAVQMAQAAQAPAIRQEALRMRELTNESQDFTVHKTTSGGFQAVSPPPRVRFRDDPVDDPYMESMGATRDDYKYGDDSVVDVVGMEQRFKKPDPPRQSWSSRYSVDQTLINLDSSKASTSETLDSMEKEQQDTTARNLFGADRQKVFGSGFSFRSNKVFGKQGVTTSNLKTDWMNNDERESTLGPAPPAKTWQEQLERKRRQRRWAMLASVFVLVLVATVATIVSSRSNDENLNTSRASVQDPITSSDTGKEKDAESEDTTPGGPHRSIAFFVSSNMPFDEENEPHRMDEDLQNPLLTEGTFLAHLGNLQIPEETECRPEVYEQVANRLALSPIPTFVLVGNSDWNDCPVPDQALRNWQSNFIFFDTEWYYEFTTQRQMGIEENFAIAVDGVLFVGVFEVEGRVWDWDEFQDRHALNIDWVTLQMNLHEDVRAVIVMGNSRTDLRQNDGFFDPLLALTKNFGKPALYIHAHVGEHQGLHYPFQGSSLAVLEAPDGGIQPPMRIHVGFGDEPFIVG